MRKVLYAILALLMSCSTFPSFKTMAQSEIKPMLSSYVPWDYGKKGKKLKGFIPPLDEEGIRPWKLAQWTGIFRFPDGEVSKLLNYDVFDIQEMYETDDFYGRNGLWISV